MHDEFESVREGESEEEKLTNEPQKVCKGLNEKEGFLVPSGETMLQYIQIVTKVIMSEDIFLSQYARHIVPKHMYWQQKITNEQG